MFASVCNDNICLFVDISLLRPILPAPNERLCVSAYRAPTNRVECGQCSTNCTIAIISVCRRVQAPSQLTRCCSSAAEVARRAHRRQRRAQPTRGPPLPGARRPDAHRHLEESHRSLHAFVILSRLAYYGVLRGQGRFLKCGDRLLSILKSHTLVARQLHFNFVVLTIQKVHKFVAFFIYVARVP